MITIYQTYPDGHTRPLKYDSWCLVTILDGERFEHFAYTQDEYTNLLMRFECIELAGQSIIDCNTHFKEAVDGSSFAYIQGHLSVNQ